MAKLMKPYTHCNFNHEEKIHDKMIVLEYQFRDHYEYFKSKIPEQLEFIDQLWVLMQRNNILRKGLTCTRVYDEIISNEMLCEIDRDIHALVLKLYRSNGKIRHRFKILTCSCEEFDKMVEKLDLFVYSPYVSGSPSEKPLAYFIEVFKDMYFYFDNLQAKMNCFSNYIYPSNEKALDKYKELVTQTDSLEELLKLGHAFCSSSLIQTKKSKN